MVSLSHIKKYFWPKIHFKIRIRVRVGVMFNVSVYHNWSNCRRSKCRTFSICAVYLFVLYCICNVNVCPVPCWKHVSWDWCPPFMNDCNKIITHTQKDEDLNFWFHDIYNPLSQLQLWKGHLGWYRWGRLLVNSLKFWRERSKVKISIASQQCLELLASILV